MKSRCDDHRQPPATQHVPVASAWAASVGADLAKTNVNGAIAIG